MDCCDAGEPTQDPQRWPLRVDAEGRTVDPPERVQPVGVSCTPAVSSAAAPTFDAHIGGGHIARDTGTGAGEEGGSGELVFAVVVVAVGMGLAFYSGLLQKFCGKRASSQYQRVPTTGPLLRVHLSLPHAPLWGSSLGAARAARAARAAARSDCPPLTRLLGNGCLLLAARCCSRPLARQRTKRGSPS